jgi:hypothetical protein
MVVLVWEMVLVCKVSKRGWSSLCFKVSTCHPYIGQCKQSQPWWSTQEMLTLICTSMRWQELARFSLGFAKWKGSKWVTFYFGPKCPLSYVMEIWIFLCFEKCFFDSKMFVIDLLRFPKHWHKPTWSWLRICKVGQMCMWVRFAIFPISFISLLFEVLRSCTRV